MVRTTLAQSWEHRLHWEVKLPFVSKICVGSKTRQSNSQPSFDENLGKGHGFIGLRKPAAKYHAVKETGSSIP